MVEAPIFIPGDACMHPVLYMMIAHAATIAVAMATLSDVLNMALIG